MAVADKRKAVAAKVTKRIGRSPATRPKLPPARTVSATEFKAKCLALLDEIEDGGKSFTITRRGVPVATIGPAKKTRWKNPAGSWEGRAVIVGDIVSDMADLWNVTRGEGA